MHRWRRDVHQAGSTITLLAVRALDFAKGVSIEGS